MARLEELSRDELRSQVSKLKVMKYNDMKRLNKNQLIINQEKSIIPIYISKRKEIPEERIIDMFLTKNDDNYGVNDLMESSIYWCINWKTNLDHRFFLPAEDVIHYLLFTQASPLETDLTFIEQGRLREALNRLNKCKIVLDENLDIIKSLEKAWIVLNTELHDEQAHETDEKLMKVLCHVDKYRVYLDEQKI
uniref:Uncharacterized protein n=1 Tax=Heterorhabditis bacteriophora TaxID=37862 RepID=A0A1I7XRZ2_HETBA